MTGIIQMYCTICGGPFLEESETSSSPSDWLSRAVLLTTGRQQPEGPAVIDLYYPSHRFATDRYTYHPRTDATNDSQRTVLEFVAVNKECRPLTLEDGKIVSVMNVIVHRQNPGLSKGTELYLPLHSACLQLADRFIAARNTLLAHQPSNTITSRMQLWEVLYRRLPGSLTNQTFVLPEPHDYLGGSRCRGKDWVTGEDPEIGKMHEQDPISIPDLTDTVLSNLRTLQPPEMLSLPQHEPAALRSTGRFGWLWDIDNTQIETKAESGRWNWEDLMNRLSESSVYNPCDISLDLPLALRNRRRIWHLLEEARVGDIASAQVKRSKEIEIERKGRFANVPRATPKASKAFPPPPGFIPSWQTDTETSYGNIE